MQARHPNNYEYRYPKPEDYTYGKKNAYFSHSGITQLGYIRDQLETLGAEASTSERTKATINQLIELIDSLADKSFGSSAKIMLRLRTLDDDLMKIFTIENGAIVFEDAALLIAAKVTAQGIAAIEPRDLNPPKLLLAGINKNNNQLCETIKSTMHAIGAQINFLFQLEKNAEASEELYELMNNILDITRDLRSIVFNNNTITDRRQNNGQGKEIGPSEVLQRVNAAITGMNDLIQQYTNSECSSITLRTMGERLAPKATFELMLSSGCNLEHIKRDGYDIPDKAKIIVPVFMTTTVPFEALKLASSLKDLVESTESYARAQPDNAPTQREIDKTTTNLANMMTSLKGAIERKTGNATLKENMEKFKHVLVEQLGGYMESAMQKDRKKDTTNNKKLEIANNLMNAVKAVNLEMEFTPNDQFAQYISTVAKAYYNHNHHCTMDGKAPGNLGKILVDAMNYLAELSENIVANDSFYHQRNIETINDLLNIRTENTHTNRP